MASRSMQAVILAAGLGTRLRPYTLFLPKPMLPLGEKPVLAHLIEWLKAAGVKDIVIALGYLGRVIENYFADGAELGVNITYIRTNRPMGTAGQLKSAERVLNRTFICAYGDSLYDFPLREVVEFHRAKKALATTALTHYRARLKYGFIETDSHGRLKKWSEKPEIKGLINSGCYVMEPGFLKYIPEGEVYSMDKAFQRAIKAGEAVCGYVAKGTFTDLGDRSAYKAAHEKYLDRLGEIL